MALAGSMSSGIAGLKAHMSALNVVGNNVANVNTYGYKAGRVTFRESVYSTQAAAADGTTILGGTNAIQTGYGVSIGTVDLNMATQGLEATGVATDLMIQGDGFFLMGDKTGVDLDALDKLNFSRVGNFKFDADGFLVDGTGQIAYGFVTCNSDAATNTKDTSAGLNGELISTQLVPIQLPLEITQAFLTANSTHPELATAKIGDALYVGVDTSTGQNVGTGTPAFVGVEDLQAIEVEGVSIDKSGKITGINRTTSEPVLIGYVALGFVSNPAALTHTDGPYYQALGGTGDISVSVAGGAVTGAMNNGVATASQLGNTGTTLMSNFLEQSGTDLATEFANMILYQRGYQANTRIVTVTDTMLEELINMKR